METTQEIKPTPKFNSPNNSLREKRKEEFDDISEKFDPLPSGNGTKDRDYIDPVKERKVLRKFDVIFILFFADSIDICYQLAGGCLLIGQS